MLMYNANHQPIPFPDPCDHPGCEYRGHPRSIGPNTQRLCAEHFETACNNYAEAAYQLHRN